MPHKKKLVFEEEAFFDCHSCGKCCRTDWNIPVEPSKADLLQRKGPDLAILQDPSGASRLGRSHGVCAFLDSTNLCSIHGELGPQFKPKACRLFPFVVTPTPDGLHIGLSHYCPSARESKGRPVSEHAESLREVLKDMDFGRARSISPLTGKESLGWTTYRILETALLQRLEPSPVETILGLYEGLRQTENRWQVPVETLFTEPCAELFEDLTQRADFWLEKLAIGAGKEAQQWPPVYVKSLIRRKFLRRIPFLDGLKSLALIQLVLWRSARPDRAVEKFELLITHSSKNNDPIR